MYILIKISNLYHCQLRFCFRKKSNSYCKHNNYMYFNTNRQTTYFTIWVERSVRHHPKTRAHRPRDKRRRKRCVNACRGQPTKNTHGSWWLVRLNLPLFLSGFIIGRQPIYNLVAQRILQSTYETTDSSSNFHSSAMMIFSSLCLLRVQSNKLPTCY